MFIARPTARSVRSLRVKAVRYCTGRSVEHSWLSQSTTEINAASTITALTFSPLFDFTSTYFLIAGIAGVNPEVATLGSVTFARYAVQVALQYEFDAREIPDNYTTGSESPS